jgi:hypothetical protein
MVQQTKWWKPLTEDDILNMDWSTPVTQTKITPEPLQLTTN